MIQKIPASLDNFILTVCPSSIHADFQYKNFKHFDKILNTMSPLYPWIPHPWIQVPGNQKYLKNCVSTKQEFLLSLFQVEFTRSIIYIAFTL